MADLGLKSCSKDMRCTRVWEPAPCRPGHVYAKCCRLCSRSSFAWGRSVAGGWRYGRCGRAGDGDGVSSSSSKGGGALLAMVFAMVCSSTGVREVSEMEKGFLHCGHFPIL
jgi:hypothetical protein